MSAERRSETTFLEARKIAQRLLGNQTTEAEARLELAMGLGQLSKLEKDLKEKNNAFKPKKHSNPLFNLIDKIKSL
jgi:hypothetical protein